MKRNGWVLLGLCTGVIAALSGCNLLGPPPTATLPPSATPPTVIPRIPTIDLTAQPGVSGPTTAGVPNNAAVPLGVTTAAADGLVLHGLYYPASTPAPGVLLQHMMGRNKEDWNSVAAALQAAGFAVLAVDLRGHGATGGQADWLKAQDDMRLWLDWLRQQPNVNGERVGTVGASIGANLSLVGCADDAQCRTTVLLSPGLDYRGVRTEPAMAGLGARPILLVASEDDTYSADTVRKLDALAQGAHQLQMYSKAGHGTDMLNVEAGLQDLIVNWLLTHLM